MTLTKYIIQHIQYTLLFNPWIIDIIIETRGKNNILKSSHEHTHTLDCRTSRYAWKRIVNFRGFRDKRKQAIHTTPRIRTWGVEQFYRFFFFVSSNPMGKTTTANLNFYLSSTILTNKKRIGK